MYQEKISGRVILFIFTNIFSTALSYETLNCSPTNFAIDTGLSKIKSPIIVNFTYNRHSLALYLYPRTFSVNLFITESLISVKGSTEKEKKVSSGFINHEKQYVTEVAGIANFDDISNYKVGLKDCRFFISDKVTGRFYNKSSTTLEATIYYTVEQCLAEKLCKSLSTIRYADVIRAKQSPRYFGSLSIWSKTLYTRFPKMIPPKLLNRDKPKKRVKLIEAADLIVGSIARGFRTVSKGTIDVPDVKHGIYSASKGTFSGLDRLVRADNYTVKVSSTTKNPQVLSFTFGIPKGNVVYKDYRAFSLVPVVGSLFADVSDVLFNAMVAIDFSRRYCRAYLEDFTMVSAGTSKTYHRGGLSFFTNPIMQWLVNIWDTEILIAIENQLQWAMSAYVQNKFDCEKFRP